jgi:hypothetical protein
MSSAYGIKAIKPTDAEHVLGFANAQTATNPLFEIWNGSSDSTLRFTVDGDGQLQAVDGDVSRPSYSFEDDKDSGIYWASSEVRTAIGGANVVQVAAAGVTITGTLTVTGEIEAGSAGLHLGDNELQTFGGTASAPDYWMGYSTSATRFEFSSTTGGGGSTDGVVFHVTDGADDVVFTGNITATNIAGTLTTAAQTAITSIGTIGTGTWEGTSVKSNFGGTGLTSYTAGDLLYYASSTALSKLAIGSANTVLTSTGSAPAWTAGLTNTHISASAEIAVSKLADGAARQLLQTDSGGSGVEWTSNVDVPGTLDVTGVGAFDTHVTVAGDLTVAGTINSSASGIILSDDEELYFGTGSDYWFQYDSGNTQFEFMSTDVNGSGSDGVVFHVDDGTDDVVFTGNITATGISGTLTTASQTNITGVGTIGTGTWQADDVLVAHGGTGLSSYSAGQMLYYASGTAFSKLSLGSANYVMTSSGSAPQWVQRIANAALPTNIDVGGTLDVTGATVLDSTLTVASGATLATAKVSDLTSGRVVIAGTDGELADHSALTYNTSTGALSATSFSGSFSGTASTATVATTITVADSSDSSSSPLFVESATGNLGAKTDSQLTYNASSGLLSATILTATGDANVGDDLSLSSDGAIVNFGVNSDVNLTHVHDTGLLLNGTSKLQFNDDSQYVQGESATKLTIAGGAEVEINTTTIDLNASSTVLVGNDLGLDSDASVLYFGVNSDVNLTHVHDTGLLLNSSRQLQFGDAQSYIAQSSNGVLRIDGEDTIDMNASVAVLVSNDLKLDSDAAVLSFGADSEITLTHSHNDGLILNTDKKLYFYDATQYIHSPNANDLTLYGNGTAVTIKSEGMGINASSPGAKLVVADAKSGDSDPTNNIIQIIQNTDATANNYASIMWKDAQGNDASAVTCRYVNHTNNESELGFWTRVSGGNVTQAVNIDSSQRVGIGTTSAHDKLHVVGSLFLEDGSPEVTFETTSSSHVNWQVACQENVSNTFEISAGSQDADASNDTFTPRILVNSAGEVAIGSSIAYNGAGKTLNLGTNQNNVLSFESGTDKWSIYAYDRSGGAHYTDLSIGGALVYCDVSATRVGINTSAPAGMLHVKDGDTVIAPNESADNFVVSQKTGDVGISLMSGSANCIIAFGDEASADDGAINYIHGDRLMRFKAADTSMFWLASDGFYLHPAPSSGSPSGNNQFRVSSAGSSTTTMYIGNASITVSSDRRLKTNIVDSSLDAVDALNQLRVTEFEWDDPSDTSFNNRNARGVWTGMIAQEVVEHLPFTVNAPRDEDGSLDWDEDSDSTWQIEPMAMCGVLVKAIQELSTRIEELENG